MKQVGIAFDVNCPSYRFIGSGNNVSLTTQANTLNVYDILKYNKFIVVKDAVATIEEVYA